MIRIEPHVHLKTRAGSTADGHVNEIHSPSISVDFPSGSDVPSLGIAERVRLTFAGKNLGAPLEVYARTIFREVIGGDTRYRFEITQKTEQILRNLLGRRVAPRITMGGAEPIPVQIQPGEGKGSLEAVLHDISATGLSLLFGMEEEITLTNSEVLHLSFCLPPSEEPIHLTCRIRYRALSGTTVRYGMEYVANADPDFADIPQRLADFIRQRMDTEADLRGEDSAESLRVKSA